MTSFIKAIRGEDASFLDLAPNANHLLNVIARRSRRTKCSLNNLDIGESFISYKSVGLTEQQYRTAKKQLEKWAFVEFRIARKVTGGVTSGVTVARLIDSRVYDINAEEGNATVTPTQRQPNANPTSNKECKNVKNDNNVKEVIDHLNLVTNAKYKHTTKSHFENISARLGEGHSVDDLKSVINSKASEWLNNKDMIQYLRPSTLFQASKFQGYLLASKPLKTKTQAPREFSQ